MLAGEGVGARPEADVEAVGVELPNAYPLKLRGLETEGGGRDKSGADGGGYVKGPEVGQERGDKP